jgi:hypothetical protein
VNGEEADDEGEKSLEPELYVDTLRHAVVHCLDDIRDGREGDGVQGDEALEGGEGNGLAMVISFSFFIAQGERG